jgi:hypothetical protein
LITICFRVGTAALSYLLAYEASPTPPRLDRVGGKGSMGKGLMWEGLVRVEGPLGGSRKVYRLTDSGRDRAAAARATVRPATLQSIDATKQLVTSMTFNQLLRYIYGRHPDMATRSKFDG